MNKTVAMMLLAAFCGVGGLIVCQAADDVEKSVKKIADAEGASYKIAIGDILAIQVYQETDLSGEFEVKEDGKITYPLLGSVKVSDLAKSEVESTITRLLADSYLVNPYVHITIKLYHKRNILVLGCVQKPGPYSFPDDNKLTLLETISMAGGFTGYASVDGTRIVRTTGDGKKNSINPGAGQIISGRKKDVALEPGDLIVIPERLF